MPPLTYTPKDNNLNCSRIASQEAGKAKHGPPKSDAITLVWGPLVIASYFWSDSQKWEMWNVVWSHSQTLNVGNRLIEAGSQSMQSSDNHSIHNVTINSAYADLVIISVICNSWHLMFLSFITYTQIHSAELELPSWVHFRKQSSRWQYRHTKVLPCDNGERASI